MSKVEIGLVRQRIEEQWAHFREANVKKESDSVENQVFCASVNEQLSPQASAIQSKQPLSTHFTLLLSLSGNLLISAAKFFAYTRTGHAAMFTEAVHTLVDVGNQAILVGLLPQFVLTSQGFGLRTAERTPDKSHQYGYGRAAFFFSLLFALSTFGFGSIYTGL